MPDNTTFRYAELVMTSTGSLCWFNPSATSDSANSRNTPTPSFVTEEAGFGVLWSADPYHLKVLREVRIDGQALAASTFSISVSPTFGSGYSETKQVSWSASSFPQVSRVTFDTEARYPKLRIRSNDGSFWRIARFHAEAEGFGRES